MPKPRIAIIHKVSTRTPLPDHWLAALTVDCGLRLLKAEPVVLARAERCLNAGVGKIVEIQICESKFEDTTCEKCFQVENSPTKPCVSYWECGEVQCRPQGDTSSPFEG